MAMPQRRQLHVKKSSDSRADVGGHDKRRKQKVGVVDAAEEQVPNYMANRMRKATMRQKRPIASDRAKPKMA